MWIPTTPMQTTRTNGAGRLLFGQSYPGDYEVALMLPTATGELDDWGRQVVEARAWKTWTLSTADSPHELVVELEDDEGLQLTRYSQLSGKVTDVESGTALGNVQLKSPGEVARAWCKPHRKGSTSGPPRWVGPHSSFIAPGTTPGLRGQRPSPANGTCSTSASRQRG